MKTLQFKLCFLMFIASTTLIAQKENVYTKKFKTNKNTTILLKLLGGPVEIAPSFDDNFYVEYSIEFENYSKRKKKGIIEKVQIETRMIDNHITLVDKSKFYFYRFNLIMESFSKNDSIKEQKYSHKSKNVILAEIKDKALPKSFYVDFISNSNRYSESKKTELINRYNSKKRKKHKINFIIKVPSHINLTIDAKDTKIRINNDMQNIFSVRQDGGKFIAKSLNNGNNVIKIKDADFLIEEINGGELTLNNIRNGLIGSINETKLIAEFSNLEIGELQKNNTFTGFSNDILIHNFSDNFNQFNLFSEYSKVHYFKLNNDYALKAFGYNTVVNIDNVIRKTEPTKNGEKKEFFKIEPTNKGLFSGTMNFDITHGFIYLH